MNTQTDQQVYEAYMRSQGLTSVDVGSQALRRKEVNRQLINKGYKPLKGYKPKRQLIAIMKNI